MAHSKAILIPTTLQDKTFGLKNKKGKKQQQIVKQISQQVKGGNDSEKKVSEDGIIKSLHTSIHSYIHGNFTLHSHTIQSYIYIYIYARTHAFSPPLPIFSHNPLPSSHFSL